MAKVKFLVIDKTHLGRRFAISDIHGCYKSFVALLKQINLTREDQLFILGDLINRGSASAELLDYILQLQEKGYRLFILRGNHEDMVLKSVEKPKEIREKILSTLQATCLLNKDGDIKSRYLRLLKSTYHYFELDNYFLVHAGFDFSSEEPFKNAKAMMYIKSFNISNFELNGKKIIMGHSPKPLMEILKRISSKKRKLYIDNGCINTKQEGFGNLVCLNIDTKSLIVQRNVEA